MALLNCLLPIYNSEQDLEETLDSIRQQSFKDFEILAYDDGSQDQSLSILQKIKKKEKRLHIFNNEDRYGIPYALNQLLNRSKSRFFAFHGSHDLSHPERFAKQLDRMKDSSLVALGTPFTLDGTRIGKEIIEVKASYLPKQVLYDQAASPQRRGIHLETGMYSRQILKKSIEFEETMPALYDILFNGEIQHHFPLRISNLQENLYTMRLYPSCPMDLLAKGRIRVDLEQIENFFLKKLLPIFSRYVNDAQISSAIKIY